MDLPSASTRTSSEPAGTRVCITQNCGTCRPPTGWYPRPVNGGRSTNGPPVRRRDTSSVPPMASSKRSCPDAGNRSTSTQGASARNGDPGYPRPCASCRASAPVANDTSAARSTNPETRS